MLKKEDVPRIRRFLGILMRSSYSGVPGKDMVQMVHDMEWLAQVADKLDKPQPAMKVVSTSPIVEKKKKR